jgi:hypothetical protein
LPGASRVLRAHPQLHVSDAKWQSSDTPDNKRESRARTKTKIERQFVATFPNREHSTIAAKNHQPARTRAFEQQWLAIELIAGQ